MGSLSGIWTGQVGGNQYIRRQEFQGLDGLLPRALLQNEKLYKKTS